MNICRDHKILESGTHFPCHTVGNRQRGHYERGLFTGGISRISKFSNFSRKWSDSPLFLTVWGLSRISRISRISTISRKSTFLKRPLFQKTPFPNLTLDFGPNRPPPKKKIWGVPTPLEFPGAEFCCQGVGGHDLSISTHCH